VRGPCSGGSRAQTSLGSPEAACLDKTIAPSVTIYPLAEYDRSWSWASVHLVFPGYVHSGKSAC